MFNLVKKVHAVTLATIALALPTYGARAGTLGSSTSYSGAWGWTFSYENVQFTRANITLDDGTIIAAPTFDITEGPDCKDGALHCTGSALFKGILKVTHGPYPNIGEAWAAIQMKWPEITIDIYPQTVDATDPDGNTYQFLKESRVYKVTLNNGINTDKLTDGFRRIVPELPHSGVYAVCDGSTSSLANYLCDQKIGYGSVAFDPNDIFQAITTASGQTITPYVGFYWDEACLAFKPENLNILVNGQDFNLKEDTDGYFRACEGRSIAFNACTPNPNATALDSDGNKIFNCNDTNPDGEHFTFILADAAAGDRLEPAPTTTCIGTDVADWLKLATYADSDEKLVITPCDPNQGYMELPYKFSDSSIWFTESEGDATQIDGLKILGFANQFGTALVLEESPDKTASIWDFSRMNMDAISSISGLELDDTVTASAGSDVLLGGNGDDRLFGFSGNDCIDGQQNDDQLWGDSHALNALDADSTNDVDVVNGADVFVLTAKLGKDTIWDFNGADPEGDRIVNVSGTTPTITANADGTYTVALKGQNYVIVHVAPGGGFVAARDVVSQTKLSSPVNYKQCSGHPAY